MNKPQGKAQIQITDLIDESVENAVARRQKGLESEGFEIDLSGDEKQIKGGVRFTKIIIGVIVEPPQSSQLQ